MWKKILFNRFFNCFCGRQGRNLAWLTFSTLLQYVICLLILILKCRGFICNKLPLALKSFEKFPENCLVVCFHHKSSMKFLQNSCTMLGRLTQKTCFLNFQVYLAYPSSGTRAGLWKAFSWPGCIPIVLLLKSIVSFESLTWTYFCSILHFFLLVTLLCQDTRTLSWPSFTLHTLNTNINWIPKASWNTSWRFI